MPIDLVIVEWAANEIINVLLHSLTCLPRTWIDAFRCNMHCSNFSLMFFFVLYHPVISCIVLLHLHPSLVSIRALAPTHPAPHRGVTTEGALRIGQALFAK